MSVDRYQDNESGVMKMLREFLQQDLFSDIFCLPQIVSYEEEFSLARGRADFVLFHADGSITVVEAKAAGGVRNILGGIGQLLSYTIQIGMSKGLNGEVRGMLVAPVEIGTYESRLIDDACCRAGMTFAPCMSIQAMNDAARKIIERAKGISYVAP